MRQSIICLFLLTLPLHGGESSEKKVQEWMSLLKHQESGKRERAAFFLGKEEVKAAVPHLSARIRDPNEDLPVKLEAISSLAWIGGDEACAILKAVLADSKNQKPEVRALAAAALGACGKDQGLNSLLEALEDEQEPIVQWKIVQAINRMGPHRAQEAVVKQNASLPNAQASGGRQNAFSHRWD